MALFDANDLLATLGGQNLSSNTPYQTLQDYHSHGQSLLDQQMPNLMTSPWQGVSYALGKFLGRNEQDSVNNVEKQTVMNGLDKYMFGGQQQPQGGQPQGAPMTQQPQAPQQLQQPQSPQPQAPSPGAVAPNQTAVPNAADKVVVKPASGNNPYIIPAPEAAQGLPNGDKIIATIDAQGKETPVGAQPGAPQAAPQAGPPGMPGQQTQSEMQPQQTSSGDKPDFLANLKHSFPPAAPPISEDEAKFLFNLPPETRQQYIDQRQQRYTPYTVETPWGKYWQMRDGSGREGYYSIPQIKPFEAGGFKGNQVLQQNPQTGKIEGNIVGPNGENGQSIEDIAKHFGAVQGQIEAGQAGVKATAEGSAKDYNDKYSNLQQAGTNAQDEIKNLQAQRGIIDNPQFQSGALHEYVNAAGKLVNQIPGMQGVGVGKTAELQQSYEKLRSAQNLTSLQTLRGLGQIRVAEINLINNANGTLSNDVGTNRAINEINQRASQRAVEVAQMAREYKQQHGALDQGFDDQLAQFKTTNPLFTDKEVEDYSKLFNKSSQGNKPTTSSYKEGSTATNPKTGEKLVFKNGAWTNAQ